MDGFDDAYHDTRSNLVMGTCGFLPTIVSVAGVIS